MKKLIINLRRNKISKNKLKKLISALDESSLTKKWVRGILTAALCAIIINKFAENYDEKKTLKDNAEMFIKYVKKIKKKGKREING